MDELLRAEMQANEFFKDGMLWPWDKILEEAVAMRERANILDHQLSDPLAIAFLIEGNTIQWAALERLRVDLDDGEDRDVLIGRITSLFRAMRPEIES